MAAQRLTASTFPHTLSLFISAFSQRTLRSLYFTLFPPFETDD
jgi:hypothetical protein